MNKTIAEFHNKLTHMSFFINDRMSEDKDKNRIMFEIAQMNDSNEKVNSLVFFMETTDAKYLAHRILNNELTEPFNRVRGKDGKVRTITISQDNTRPDYYTIKIDNGTGIAQANGFTKASKDKVTLFYNLPAESMKKAMLETRDRILLNTLIFEIKKIISPC